MKGQIMEYVLGMILFLFFISLIFYFNATYEVSLTFLDVKRHNIFFFFLCVFFFTVLFFSLIFSIAFLSVKAPQFPNMVYYFLLFLSLFITILVIYSLSYINYHLYLGADNISPFPFWNISRIYSIEEKRIIFLQEGLRVFNEVGENCGMYKNKISLSNVYFIILRSATLHNLPFYINDWVLSQHSVEEIKALAVSRIIYILRSLNE